MLEKTAREKPNALRMKNNIFKMNLLELQYDDGKIWLFNINQDRVKKISPLFDGISDQSNNSIFALFVCLVAFSTSPQNATMDKWRIYVVIHRLLNGFTVERKSYIGCVTKHFSAFVGAVLQGYSRNKYLKRGPSMASIQSDSVLGHATAIITQWNTNTTSIPNLFHPINNALLKKTIIDMIYLEIKKKGKDSISENHVQNEMQEEESYPNMDDFII